MFSFPPNFSFLEIFEIFQQHIKATGKPTITTFFLKIMDNIDEWDIYILESNPFTVFISFELFHVEIIITN